MTKNNIKQIILVPVVVENFSLLPVKPMVSICCITYNHEKFIKDAIEGFLMQKTDFPIEIIIHDDASTDSTADIVREYQAEHPDLIRAVYQTENQFSQGNLHVLIATLFKMARGKYIALCEGDDYWTDPLKLQKQVDFMEAHPECSISGHKVLYRYENYPEESHEFPDLTGNQVFSKEEMYGRYISPTCSIMFRRQNIAELVRYLDGFKVGDLPLFHFYWQLGKFGFIDQVMATFRIASGSYWYLRNERQRIPILFDTYVKIKNRLNITRKNGLGGTIIYYALELLQIHYSQRNYQEMRTVIIKSFSSINSANKKQLRKFLKYSIIAFLPITTRLKRFSHIT